ncbi:hypothetical protein RJ639_038086 [Escallonia herrerae]|uniref:Uncharacterized protein n=1 Tax=Escallonia herrerae TaxID=1293975 RepID=A0AA89BAJ1_9ASTE|nr:hypothetical protein RJ639_038086 [Escallonia herrerae]
MGFPSLSIRLAFVISFSVAASYTTTSSSFPLKPLSFSTTNPPQPKPKPKPRASASDLLALLGPPQQASTINAKEARQLRSCFKFLVPFSSCPPGPHSETRRALSSRPNCEQDEVDELVWWPPAAVAELARLAVDSGGDPGAIQRALDPTMIIVSSLSCPVFILVTYSVKLCQNVLLVPDIEGSNKSRCELTRIPYGRHFINEELNSYLKLLFEIIAARGPNVGLDVSLSRYDLFHGHIFLATDSGRLGILFHAKEYPAYDKEVFPYNMGYCQRGSNVMYDDSMNLRNILWLAPLPNKSTQAWLAPGVLVVLDARPRGIIYTDLIPDYVDYARTLYEDDFGDVVADVNYLNVGGAKPDFQIFIC